MTLRSWSTFPRWIAAGHAGEMKYLEARDEQGRLKRASLAHAAPVGSQRRGVRHQLQHGATVFHAGARDATPRLDLPLRLGPAGLSRLGDAAPAASRSGAEKCLLELTI